MGAASFRVPLARLAVLAAAAVTASCARGGDAGMVVVRDSAGVSIVENAGTDRPLGGTLTHRVDLVPPDSALTAVPWGVVADGADGRVYVVDRTGARVVVFDTAGGTVATLGRSGGGPGEFRAAMALALDTGGVVVVWDTGRRMLSRWSSRGTLLEEEQAPLRYWGPGFSTRAGRLSAVVVEEEDGGRTLLQRLVEVGDGRTTVLHELPRVQTEVEVPCMPRPILMPRLFAPDVTWTARGDTSWVVNGAGYRIDAFADGALVESVRRPLDPIAVTDEAAATRIQAGQFRGFIERCGITPVQLVAAVGHEDAFSPLQWLAVDPGGRLWVTRTTDGVAPAFVDVFAPGGRYVGTLPAPAVIIAFAAPSLAVGLRVEESGQPVLALYALTDGPGGR